MAGRVFSGLVYNRFVLEVEVFSGEKIICLQDIYIFVSHGRLASTCYRLPIPPTEMLLSCLWSRRIFPSLPGSRFMIFYRDASSSLSQLVH